MNYNRGSRATHPLILLNTSSPASSEVKEGAPSRKSIRDHPLRNISIPYLYTPTHNLPVLNISQTNYKMRFNMIFDIRSGSSSSKAPAAAATTIGTPVKSAKVKMAGRKNPRGVKISNPIFVQPTAADLTAVREMRNMMLTANRYRRAAGALERRPRVAKPKKKTDGHQAQSQLQNDIEPAAAANFVCVEVAQFELSPLKQLELQILEAFAMVGDVDYSSH